VSTPEPESRETPEVERFLAYAAHARTKPTFDEEEREYKLEIAQRLRGMLRAASQGSLEPQPGVATVFAGRFSGRKYELTSNEQNAWLRSWAAADGESLMQALAQFLTGYEARSRFSSFAESAQKAHETAGIGADPQNVLIFGSLFNFALEPEHLPIVSPVLFEMVEQLFGWETKSESLTDRYIHHVEFTHWLSDRMSAEGIPIRDMLDVASLIWVSVEERQAWMPALPSKRTPLPPSDASSGGERDRESVYLSVCTIYRNAASDLAEWLELHRLMGVQRFYLYDNLSDDHHLEVLEPYLKEGLVVLQDWPVFPAPQMPAYEHCLREHREESRWIAFIDIDEFLFSPNGQPLPDLLTDYERWPGIGVLSAVFGPSGHRTTPPGLVLENYRKRRDLTAGGKFIKSIVDPKRTVGAKSVHHFEYVDGLAVDENGYTILEFAVKTPSLSRLRINHYWAKSEEEAWAKLAMPMAATGSFRPWIDVRAINKTWNETDEVLLAYLPAIREALARNKKR
jgi:hypothetical protein